MDLNHRIRIQLYRWKAQSYLFCIMVAFYDLRARCSGEKRVKRRGGGVADLQRLPANRLHIILTSPSQHFTGRQDVCAPSIARAQWKYFL